MLSECWQTLVKFRQTFDTAIQAVLRLQRNWRQYVRRKNRSTLRRRWLRMCRYPCQAALIVLHVSDACEL
jgi:hypothetical protein